MNQLTEISLTLQVPWGWHEEGHMSMHWGWALLWLAVLVTLVWLVMSAGAGGRGAGRASETKESVEEVLRRRFARGDIDEEEFDRRMRTLRKSRDGS